MRISGGEHELQSGIGFWWSLVIEVIEQHLTASMDIDMFVGVAHSIVRKKQNSYMIFTNVGWFRVFVLFIV
jgi:hypothetical protein